MVDYTSEGRNYGNHKMHLPTLGIAVQAFGENITAVIEPVPSNAKESAQASVEPIQKHTTTAYGCEFVAYGQPCPKLF